MVTGTGIFHGGLTFFRRNFLAILLCISLPVIAQIVLTLAVNHVRMQHLLAMLESGETRTVAKHSPVLALLSFVVTLISAVMTSWLSARIYRLRLKEEFAAGAGEFAATLRVFLWSLAAAAAFTAIYVLCALAVGLLPDAGPRLEFLPVHFTPGQAARVALNIAVVIYLAHLMVRFGLLLPGLAFGRRGTLSLAEWRKTRSVSWSLLGVLFLNLLVISAITYLLVILLLAPWTLGIGSPTRFMTVEDILGGRPYARVAADLVSEAGTLLAMTLTAVTFAEGYAQLNRPRA
jgi:hypothetical protein